LEGREEAVEECSWGQIVDYSILGTEEGQASGMILLLDLEGQECSPQIMDQDRAICIHSSLELLRLEAREASLILSEEVEEASMIHLVDQEEEEAASDQAEVAVVDLVLEEASVEAVASDVVVDLVVLEVTSLETIIIDPSNSRIDIDKNKTNTRI
jgi:hypothetical protein